MINSVNKQYVDHIRYRFCILIAIGLFTIGIGAGLVFAFIRPASIVNLFSEELSALTELGAMFSPFKATTAIFIFFKNTFTLLISFIFSPILCLLPILALLLNGSLISFVSVMVAQEESLGLLLAGMLPHGIFEIPALIIGEAAALSFGATLIIAIFTKKKREPLMKQLKQSLQYLLLAFALLVPAAIIETFVTPLFLQ
jgi:stage II sporulation protein M